MTHGILNLLLIEDDRMVSRALSLGLGQAGYSVFPAYDLADAKNLLRERSFNVAVLDVNLPDGSGLSLLQDRNLGSSLTRILVLTARQDEETAIQALRDPRCEFIRKPVGFRELVIRLSRFYSSMHEKSSAPITLGKLVVSIDQREALFSGKRLELSRREYSILELLAKNAGHVVSRDRFLNSIDSEGQLFERTVDSHVSRLRRKLKNQGVNEIKIDHVWGEGYRLLFFPGGAGF